METCKHLTKHRHAISYYDGPGTSPTLINESLKNRLKENDQLIPFFSISKVRYPYLLILAFVIRSAVPAT